MPRPAALATHKLLSSFHHNPALPKHTFYFLASVAFSALNRPDEIPRIWRYALENVAIPGSAEEEYVKRELAGRMAEQEEGRESALVIHRKIREALLKSVVICGLPVTINALTALTTATPPHLLPPPPPAAAAPSPRPPPRSSPAETPSSARSTARSPPA
ncbi:uncharacterized protein LAJ45_00806 [Morchella importuna]|uniref:uncharacterized protein n=1 Tax=Morchella importuna TaxID=1174673 RepID=UPI001E8DBA95|nr:uncharacterized protein LAJ45_00806 [Morchella importuna]KAH8155794.1 hypothetical protein LAJ45_00806 [Morchella importuna]